MKKDFLIFERFNRHLRENKISKPLVILIGGYCGSGKSTIARKLQSLLPNFNIIPTGVIRAVYYETLKKRGKIFSCHTYDLYKYSRSEKELFQNYINQARALFKPIVNLSNFSASEKQNFIVEGNHVLPELRQLIKKVYCFDFYLKEENSVRLIANMQSVTHRRNLNKKQCETAVKLNKFLIEKLTHTDNTKVFNVGEDYKILKYVANQLKEIIK